MPSIFLNWRTRNWRRCARRKRFFTGVFRGDGRPAQIPRTPSLAHPKKQITLRLDEDVIARFRDSGKGWQGRMNTALRKAAGL